MVLLHLSGGTFLPQMTLIGIEKNVSSSSQLSLLVSPKTKFILCESLYASLAKKGELDSVNKPGGGGHSAVGLLKITIVWFL